MLGKDDPSFVIKRTKELVPTTQTIVYRTFLEGGWSNRNYLVAIGDKDVVIRLKNPLSKVSRLEFDYFDNPLTPELLGFDEVSGDMVTSFVEGDMLVDSPIDPETAAYYIKELHEHIPQGIRTYQLDATIGTYLEGLRMAEEIAEVYTDLDWEPKTSQGCHNELNDWNVIKTDNGFCTLDWEAAGDHDPIFDIVGLCYGLEYSDDEFQTCIATYQPHVDWEHVRRTRIVYQVREHAWALDRIRHGSSHEGILKQKFDTEEEIKRLA